MLTGIPVLDRGSDGLLEVRGTRWDTEAELETWSPHIIIGKYTYFQLYLGLYAVTPSVFVDLRWMGSGFAPAHSGFALLTNVYICPNVKRRPGPVRNLPLARISSYK